MKRTVQNLAKLSQQFYNNQNNRVFDEKFIIADLERYVLAQIYSLPLTPHTLLLSYVPRSRVIARLIEAKLHSLHALRVLIDFRDTILDEFEKMKLYVHHSALCYCILASFDLRLLS